MIKNEITPAITHIVNLSIKTSVFPTLWKHSKVIPLFKPGVKDKLNAKSYRLLALLPVASKVLERVVFLQIVEYMDKNRLFHPNHHGFRSLHSTTTAMIQMYDTWVEALERSEMAVAGVAMINQSAAPGRSATRRSATKTFSYQDPQLPRLSATKTSSYQDFQLP